MEIAIGVLAFLCIGATAASAFLLKKLGAVRQRLNDAQKEIAVLQAQLQVAVNGLTQEELHKKLNEGRF